MHDAPKDHPALIAAERFLPREPVNHPNYDFRLWRMRDHVEATDGRRAIVIQARGLGRESQRNKRRPPVEVALPRAKRVGSLNVERMRREIARLPRKTVPIFEYTCRFCSGTGPKVGERGALPDSVRVASWSPLRLRAWSGETRGACLALLDPSYLVDLLDALDALGVKDASMATGFHGREATAAALRVEWEGGYAVIMGRNL